MMIRIYCRWTIVLYTWYYSTRWVSILCYYILLLSTSLSDSGGLVIWLFSRTVYLDDESIYVDESMGAP